MLVPDGLGGEQFNDFLSDTRLTVVTPAAGCMATVLIFFCYTKTLIAFPETR
jgi:hypothetical protein